MQDDKNGIFQMRFPQKLWYLLTLQTDAIIWGGTGRTILLNYRILHTYLRCDHSVFKTTNISSFVRQLNLYGFRKVTSHLQDPLCNSSNPFMHEYVHDYFQYGRPELLNKITRKALTVRKPFKAKTLFYNEDQLVYLTPLQKARQALTLALKKASQNLNMQHSSQQCNQNYEFEDTPEDYCEEDEENMDFDWLIPKMNNHPPIPAQEEYTLVVTTDKATIEDKTLYQNTPQDTLNYFNKDSEQNTENDSFPNQFLSMPDLDPDTEDKTGVELLAEFNIHNDVDQSIIKKTDKENDFTYLNCVLPSVSNEDVSMAEKDNDETDQYNAEWDQMFNDMIANKSSVQECGSDLKELYSQISRTIDLLNS